MEKFSNANLSQFFGSMLFSKVTHLIVLSATSGYDAITWFLSAHCKNIHITEVLISFLRIIRRNYFLFHLTLIVIRMMSHKF